MRRHNLSMACSQLWFAISNEMWPAVQNEAYEDGDMESCNNCGLSKQDM